MSRSGNEAEWGVFAWIGGIPAIVVGVFATALGYQRARSMPGLWRDDPTSASRARRLGEWIVGVNAVALFALVAVEIRLALWNHTPWLSFALLLPVAGIAHGHAMRRLPD